MDDQSLEHTRWNCKYHIVFAPKFRRKIIYGKYKKEIGVILPKLCEYKHLEILEAHACIDHIHMCIKIPPKYSVAQIIALPQRRGHSILKKKWAYQAKPVCPPGQPLFSDQRKEEKALWKDC